MKQAKDIHEWTPWQEMTPGGEIYEPGTAALVNTGDWRTRAPVWDEQKCKQCLLCVPYCPDAAI
ncbi:MAG: 4Fe-4S binding protein, partial [Oscillospiraceae bacterium]|nr:4Fe-4S binding protein [Oscillospiraceae bacterium]